ncbi:MAG: hypothetical protein AAF989_06625 [Planctomycetota bacterium]
MALVFVRGAFRGEPAEAVASESIAMLLVFALVGAFAGWIADHLVLESVETMFRNRVEWYRNGVLEAEASKDKNKNTN